MSDTTRRDSVILLVTRNGMGHGDSQLQQELLAKYLRLLDENNMLPGAICFYTEGVMLVADGSPVLDLLRSLEERGVPLLVCLTCLNHYGLARQGQGRHGRWHAGHHRRAVGRNEGHQHLTKERPGATRKGSPCWERRTGAATVSKRGGASPTRCSPGRRRPPWRG